MGADPVDTAAEALYGMPLSAFTAERKRLADALKQGGDKKAAAAVAKLARPSMSAWVVNQLHREARDDLDALLAAGAKLREGDFAASAAHQAALGRLRATAADILRADDHAATEPTLRRVAMTLQALAATGSFDPDPPGRLIEDRDPPGFEALAALAAAAPPPRAAPPPPPPPPPPRAEPATQEATAEDPRAAAEVAAEAEAAAAAAAAEAKAAASAREAKAAAIELARAERDATTARADLTLRRRDVEDLRRQLTAAETALDRATSRAEAAEATLVEARARVKR